MGNYKLFMLNLIAVNLVTLPVTSLFMRYDAKQNFRC